MPPRKRTNPTVTASEPDDTEVRYLHPGDAVEVLPDRGEAIYLGPHRKPELARLRTGTAHGAPVVVPFALLDYVEPQNMTPLHSKFYFNAKVRGEI